MDYYLFYGSGSRETVCCSIKEADVSDCGIVKLLLWFERRGDGEEMVADSSFLEVSRGLEELVDETSPMSVEQVSMRGRGDGQEWCEQWCGAVGPSC